MMVSTSNEINSAILSPSPSLSSSSSSPFGLFDTLVPISSIATISIAVGYTLPKREYFGLFLLVWWTVAVIVSLNNCLFQSPTHWTTGTTTTTDVSSSSLSSSSSSSVRLGNDTVGFIFFITFPLITMSILWIWFQRRRSIRLFVIRDIPIWTLIAVHIYRIDGLSLIVPYINGTVPKFIGFQTIVLDVVMGVTAIPLSWILYHRRTDLLTDRSLRLKDVLWIWNSLGVYDIGSGFLIFILNFFRIGGDLIIEPPLSKLGFHPFPLLIFFQVPLALATHLLMLIHADEMVEWQSRDLPIHTRHRKKTFW